MKGKILSRIIVFFLALGIVAIYLESELEVSDGIRAGAGLLGIASLLWGVEEIVNHQDFYSFSWQKNDRNLTLRTFASIAVSFLRLLIGIGLITISLLGFLELGGPAASFIISRPGLAMAFISALGFTYGAQQFLMAKKQGEGFKVVLEKISGRIFGVILVLVSCVVVALGLVEILWPDAFQNYWQLFLSRFNFPIALE